MQTIHGHSKDQKFGKRLGGLNHSWFENLHGKANPNLNQLTKHEAKTLQKTMLTKSYTKQSLIHLHTALMLLHLHTAHLHKKWFMSFPTGLDMFTVATTHASAEHLADLCYPDHQALFPIYNTIMPVIGQSLHFFAFENNAVFAWPIQTTFACFFVFCVKKWHPGKW